MLHVLAVLVKRFHVFPVSFLENLKMNETEQEMFEIRMTKLTMRRSMMEMVMMRRLLLLMMMMMMMIVIVVIMMM